MKNFNLSYSKVRKITIASVAVVLSLVLPSLLVRLGIAVFVSVLFIFTLFPILFYEIKNIKSPHNYSLLVVLLVASLPFQRIFLTTYPMQTAAQFIPILIVIFYWRIYSLDTKYLWRVRPLFFPTAAFAFSFFLSYFFSGKLETKDWSFLINLVGAVGYAYLACLHLTSMDNIKRILWILIVIGVAQFPVMYAMSRGWTERLPGALQRLNNDLWGGPASSYTTNALRYPGTFGDYELLAEYLNIMVIFCVGISLFTSSTKERFFSILASGLMITAGFYTGTRSFVIGLAVGLVTMVFLFIIRPGFGKYIKYFLIIGFLLILVLNILSTQEIFRGFIERFSKTNFSLSSFDTRDVVWRISISMMQKLPFTGYGTHMMDIFNAFGYGNLVSPHSLYFSMLLRAGFPGLFAIILMIFTPFLWMAKILFNRNMKPYHAWAIVMISVWCLWIINEVKIEFIRYPFYMNIVFLLFGIYASYYDLARREPKVIKLQNIKGLS